jgi:hypothetical protein
MRVAGTFAYQVKDCVVPAWGYSLSKSDVDEIAPAVRAILRDDSGVEEAREALEDLPTTNFATARLERLLEQPTNFDEWRVGEALAEYHLSNSKGCHFPWPNSRSTRNPGSSSGGVDLIGFHMSDRVRFVFAEVKTSHQKAWPPSVVTSRSHGLQRQLSGLNHTDDRSRWAISYLLFNSIGRPWHERLRLAIETYLANDKDIVIIGVLVHATAPDARDLSALADGLSALLSPGTTIELLGLYIEPDLLSHLANGPITVETVTT